MYTLYVSEQEHRPRTDELWTFWGTYRTQREVRAVLKTLAAPYRHYLTRIGTRPGQFLANLSGTVA